MWQRVDLHLNMGPNKLYLSRRPKINVRLLVHKTPSSASLYQLYINDVYISSYAYARYTPRRHDNVRQVLEAVNIIVAKHKNGFI